MQLLEWALLWIVAVGSVTSQGQRGRKKTLIGFIPVYRELLRDDTVQTIRGEAPYPPRDAPYPPAEPPATASALSPAPEEMIFVPSKDKELGQVYYGACIPSSMDKMKETPTEAVSSSAPPKEQASFGVKEPVGGVGGHAGGQPVDREPILGQQVPSQETAQFNQVNLEVTEQIPTTLPPPPAPAARPTRRPRPQVTVSTLQLPPLPPPPPPPPPPLPPPPQLQPAVTLPPTITLPLSQPAVDSLSLKVPAKPARIPGKGMRNKKKHPIPRLGLANGFSGGQPVDDLVTSQQLPPQQPDENEGEGEGEGRALAFTNSATGLSTYYEYNIPPRYRTRARIPPPPQPKTRDLVASFV